MIKASQCRVATVEDQNDKRFSLSAFTIKQEIKLPKSQTNSVTCRRQISILLKLIFNSSRACSVNGILLNLKEYFSQGCRSREIVDVGCSSNTMEKRVTGSVAVHSTIHRIHTEYTHKIHRKGSQSRRVAVHSTIHRNHTGIYAALQVYTLNALLLKRPNFWC